MEQVTVISTPLDRIKADAVLAFHFEDEEQVQGALAQLDQGCGGIVQARLDAKQFRGKRDQVCILYPSQGPVRLLVAVGLGRRDKWQLLNLMRAAGAGVRALPGAQAYQLAVLLPFAPAEPDQLAQAIVTGALRGAYQFTAYRKGEENAPTNPIKTLAIWCDLEESQLKQAIKQTAVVADCANWARALADEPANILTPVSLAQRAAAMAKQVGLRCKVFGPRLLKAMGANLLLAVAEGSQYPAQMLVLEHSGRNPRQAPLVLAGKGITFDTGGVNLKPSDGLKYMKYDMCGAAATLGALRALALLKIPMRVIGVIPIAENHLGGRAQRTGDIVRSLAGITVEIRNTDAEGRLILADALAYACKRLKPAALVDIATLTGACVVALGHQCAGLFGTHPELVARVQQAGEQAGERCWQLPLWDDYQEQLSSDHADVANVGGRPGASITGACFLSRFVQDLPWAHLDIAGVSHTENKTPYLAPGATGFGVGLLVKLAQRWSKLG